jgi:hypothetical protein
VSLRHPELVEGSRLLQIDFAQTATGFFDCVPLRVTPLRMTKGDAYCPCSEEVALESDAVAGAR